jgi:hypothetical protein
VLIAGDPGLHIESVRPAIKVMMIDGIKPFVNGLINGSPLLSNLQVNDFTERILNPRPKMEAPPPLEEPASEPQQPRAAWEDMYGWNEEPEQQQQQPEQSRARAIFDASKDTEASNPNDFSFAMEEGAQADDIPPFQREASSAQPARQAGPKSQRMLGMTPVQLGVIAALALAFLCLLAVFAYIIVVNPKIF